MTYRLGVDLGTTFTAAATHRSTSNTSDSNGEVRVFPLAGDRTTIPSVIAVRDDGSVVLGVAAERRAMTEPERIAREFKRRIGDPTPILIGGQPYAAEWLLARLLEWVVQTVSEQEGQPPARVAVTHPANWRSYKTALLAEALGLAGLDPATTALLSEPEAAAIAYAASSTVAEGEIIAVYDLGGGTFDAAVLRRARTGFEILGTPEGIERLGGIDFDAALFSHVTAALGTAWTRLDADDPATKPAVARLRQDCTDAKEALSFDTDAVIRLVLPDREIPVRVVRSDLEAMIGSSVSATVEAMRRAIRSAGVNVSDVSQVLLIGGSSKVPLVAERVSAGLGRPVIADAHPKHVVAVGAAYAAAGTHFRTAGTQIRANPGFDRSTSALPAGQAPTRPTAPPPQPSPTPVTTPTTSTPPTTTTSAPRGEPGSKPDPVTAAPSSGAGGSEDVGGVTPPEPAAAGGRRRRLLFAGIAAAVAITVIGGGLLASVLRSDDDEPIEMRDDTTTPVAAANWPDPLVIAAPADAATGSNRWVLDAILADRLGVEVEVEVYRDPAAVVAALTDQEVAIALLGARSYVAATSDEAPIRPAGIATAGPDDPGYTRTFGLTRASNDQINSLADIAGGVVCFADRTSVAGYLFPAAALVDAGGNASAESNLVAGDHRASVEFAADGTCPVGFARESVVEELVDNGTISGVADPSGEGDGRSPESAELKIVWKSAPITSDVLAIGTWLPADLQEQLVQVVTTQVNRNTAVSEGHCPSASDCQLTAGTTWGYAPAADADLDGWRLVCRLPDQEDCSL